ncbi:MAG: DUF5658 family protein [Gammaproteobacteria bacterium]|nr:DUF5658 family protein [Gammaproteobacteria bacterium]
MTDKVLDNNDKFKGLIFVLILLNVLDGTLTIAWIETGRAVEINPLMNMLIGVHPLLFMVIKILLVGLGAMLLWRFRDRAVALVSLYLCIAVYSVLMVYHGNGLIS